MSSLASTNLTTDAPVQRSPSLPGARRSRSALRPPAVAATCAPSLRKILPSTSPSKAGLPKAVNPGSNLGWKPSPSPIIYQTCILAAPSACLPGKHRGAGLGPQTIGYLLADPTGKAHPPGPPRYRAVRGPTAVLKRGWAWSVPARGLPGSAPAPRQAERDARARTPRLHGDALPAPTRPPRAKCRGVDQAGVVLPATRASPRGPRSSRGHVPELVPGWGHRRLGVRRSL